MFLLLFGIVEFGFNLNNAQSLRSGTSSAARNAAVLTSPEPDCTTEAPNEATRSVVCDVKSRVGLADTQVGVVVPAGWSQGESVIVCSQRRSDSLTGFFPFLENQTVTNRSEFRIERVDDETPVTFQESPPPGADWSWCANS